MAGYQVGTITKHTQYFLCSGFHGYISAIFRAFICKKEGEVERETKRKREGDEDGEEEEAAIGDEAYNEGIESRGPKFPKLLAHNEDKQLESHP